ncbi:hypothetical protein [Microbacterium sp. MMO-113]|uniref:hypothetical protein n=1 Tax=Microbacterium sp. MMO-113 TaxID=3081273 RepID=UPI00301A09AE
MTEHTDTEPSSTVDRVARSANRWTWFSRILFGLLILASIGFAVFSSIASTANREELAYVKDRLAQSETQGQALADQISLGETPVVDPAPAPRPTAPVVLNGRDGKDGADAPPPTAAQLQAAVAECFTTGACTAPAGDKGDQGAPGADGNDGADSTTPGPTGPAGPAGPAGPSGFTATPVWLAAAESETEIPAIRQAVIYIPTPTEGEPAP